MTEVDVGDSDKSKEQLIDELASMRREVAELKTTKTAFTIQQELLKNLVKTVKTATGSLMIKTVLQQIVTISSRLTNAEECSLFLLNPDGSVVESILARGAVIRELKQNLIGMVLDKGLAGWVIRYRQVGLIADTLNDERWLRLPNEPYSVRSALCVPIFRGKMLQALITLMHSKPGHFTSESSHLMQMSAEQISLILEHALLYVESQKPQLESHKIDKQVVKEVNKTDEPPNRVEKLSSFGIYIIIEDGRFLYTNPGVAAIFGYSFIEFITIESILELVATSNRRFFSDRIHQCFQAHGHFQSLSCTFKGQRKDGSLVDVQAYGTKTKFSGKPVIIGILSLG